MSFSDESEASKATTHNSGPKTILSQEIVSAPEKRVYQALARGYILERRKQETRKKRAKSACVALLSAIFFTVMIALAYWSAR